MKRAKRENVIIDKSELNLFTNVPQQNVIESNRIESIPTSCPLPSHEISVPLDFVVKGTNEFVSPNMFLHLQVQLLRGDITNTVDAVYEGKEGETQKLKVGTDSVAFVNYPLMSMWSTVEH